MTSKKRYCATSKGSKRDCSRTTGIRKKLAEDFLAHLDRPWQQHGREILDRLLAERPEVYFKALVKLAQVRYRTIGELRDFDRRRNREEALLRLEQRAEAGCSSLHPGRLHPGRWQRRGGRYG